MLLEINFHQNKAGVIDQIVGIPEWLELIQSLSKQGFVVQGRMFWRNSMNFPTEFNYDLFFGTVLVIKPISLAYLFD